MAAWLSAMVSSWTGSCGAPLWHSRPWRRSWAVTAAGPTLPAVMVGWLASPLSAACSAAPAAAWACGRLAAVCCAGTIAVSDSSQAATLSQAAMASALLHGCRCCWCQIEGANHTGA